MKRLLVIFLLLLATSSLHAQETTPEPTSDVITQRAAPPDAASFRLVTVVSGLQYPIYVTSAGDGSGRLFVVEQSGRIWILRNDVLQNTVFMNLSSLVSQDVLRGYSERGLLGLAFHPEFAQNGLFYVNYTDVRGDTQVVEYRVDANNPDVGDPATARVLLTVGQPYPNHNGGHMAFGPDGYLYISLGDGGSRDDPLDAAQNRMNLLGKILRIDVNTSTASRPYGIPEDNPFATDPTFAPEVWAYGLRNVWRFSFDRATGDLYQGDVGQNRWEEIDFLPAGTPGGANFGWNRYEGFERYLGGAPASQVVMPVAVYDHGLGCSVTGGYVYRGEAVPDMAGAYFYSDYCSGRLWTAYRDLSGSWQSAQIMQTGRRIVSFGEDDAGELYLVDYDGVILRFEPAAR